MYSSDVLQLKDPEPEDDDDKDKDKKDKKDKRIKKKKGNCIAQPKLKLGPVLLSSRSPNHYYQPRQF